MDFLPGQLILPDASISRFQERSAMDRSISLASSRQMGASKVATVASTQPTIAILALVVMAPGMLNLRQQDKSCSHLEAILRKSPTANSVVLLHLTTAPFGHIYTPH